MDVHDIPIFKIGDSKIDLPAQLNSNVREILISSEESTFDTEIRIWTDFLASANSHILVINSNVELDFNFEEKFSELNREISTIEFDCVFIGATYLRAWHNNRFFIDKHELINLYPEKLLLPDVMIGSENNAYILNQRCARELISCTESFGWKSKPSLKTIFNDLILKSKIKSFFYKNRIEKYLHNSIDSNKCGIFSTYIKPPQKDLILQPVDRSSQNWLEYEGSAIVKHRSSPSSDETHFNAESLIPSNGIYRVDSGYLLGNGVVLSRNKKILEEINLIPELDFRTERDKVRIAQILKYIKDTNHQPPIQYNGKCLNLRSFQDYIYGHALLGSVPKCHIAKQLYSKINFDYVVLPQNFKHNSYIVKFLNIPRDKILDLSDKKIYSFDQIISPTHRSPNRLYRYNNFDFMRQMFGLCSATKPFRKIYISRLGESRSPANENEIIDIFKKYQFEIINPKKDERFLPQIFLESLVVAGPHGSNLADACFCRAGTHILDILSPFHIYQYYSSLCFGIDGNYHSIIGEPLENFEKFQYTISPGKVNKVLKSII